MPDEINITEYYSVSCRPYDADVAGESMLEKARREFFTRGGSNGSVRSVEDGKEVRIRFRIGPKRFRWKKTSGAVTLQEAFSVEGGLFRLVTHDFTGKLLSFHTYDAAMRWLRTAYYDGDPADPAAVLRRGEDGLFLLRRGEESETLLAPCPWEPGTARQSFVNAKAGEPLVTARTDTGDFCFCSAEELAQRVELRNQADSAPAPSLGEDSEDTLDFLVIPNSPGWLSPRSHSGIQSGGGCRSGLTGDLFAAPGRSGNASVLSRQTRHDDLHQSVGQGETGTCGACVQAEPAEYTANLEITFLPDGGVTRRVSGESVSRSESKEAQNGCFSDHSPKTVHEDAPSTGRRSQVGGVTVPASHGKYAVAAKGLTGGVRNRLSMQSSPAVQQSEDRGAYVAGELAGSIPNLSRQTAPDDLNYPVGRGETGNTCGSIPSLSRQTVPDDLNCAVGRGETGNACGSTRSTPAKHNGSDFSGLSGGAWERQHAAELIPAKRIVVSSMESYLYFGKLLEGLREGRGRTSTPDGRTAYEGGYRSDMRDGFGVYYYKSGELCYAGGWRRNLRDGLGVAFGAKDGSIFVGNWKNGAATGPGSEFDMSGCLTYTGGWKDGRRHGYGTEYRRGRVWRSGIWQDDVFCSNEAPSGSVSS